MLFKTASILVILAVTFQLSSCLPTNSIVQSKRYGVCPNVKFSLSNPQAFSFCGTCIDFADNALDILLNEVLQVGVIGSCGAICSAVQDKTGSQVLGVVCNLLCDVVGIDEFIKIINNADLDPIYYCELLKACKINDHGDATITKFAIAPLKGPQGTTFVADLEYSSKNGTGTGEIAIDIDTVDKIPLGDSFLNLPQPAGNYGTRISIKAQPDPDCDPTQGPCESWQPGLYKVTIAICNGECGSKHPHSKIYAISQSNFTITN